MIDIEQIIGAISHQRANVPAQCSVLVGITGIDGSGKSYFAAKIATHLQPLGLTVASLSVNDWLTLPLVDLNRDNPAEHFYQRGLRLDDMFEQLVLPLKAKRSIRLTTNCAEVSDNLYRPHLYAYQNVDVILLEGIYLLKQAYQHHYDLTYWVECSFETALARVLERHGRPDSDLITAYRTIYFPAQRLHLERDNPLHAADEIVVNDPRITLVS